ncbi:MAG: hypothetical protein IT345_05705 [Trueperaceae bacterium]|nr:hypothetical protein [Trueperaceae bacterium]
MSLITLDTSAPDAPTWQPSGEIVITSAAQRAMVGERRVTINQFIKRVKDYFAPMKKAADDAHKVICQREKHTLSPAEADLAAHDRAMRAWDDDQARIAAEARRRLEDQARKDEEARRLAEALALEQEAHATGDTALLAEADALIAAPIETPVVIVEKAVPKVAGLSSRETWTFQIVDETKIPREFLVPDLTKIRGVVRAMKSATNIPGVRAYAEKSYASGGGK